MAKAKKRKKRKGKGARKGSSFERKICKELSLWWTHGKREDVYWRTAGSGNRASVRAKAGKRTRGGYGDVCATDPIGDPLLDLAVISLKNGYPKVHAMAFIDRPNKTIRNEFEEWRKEIRKCWKESGAYTWMIIHQRTGRAKVVYMPRRLYSRILFVAKKLWNYEALFKDTRWDEAVVCIRFDELLKVLTPKLVRRLVERL